MSCPLTAATISNVQARADSAGMCPYRHTVWSLQATAGCWRSATQMLWHIPQWRHVKYCSVQSQSLCSPCGRLHSATLTRSRLHVSEAESCTSGTLMHHPLSDNTASATFSIGTHCGDVWQPACMYRGPMKGPPGINARRDEPVVRRTARQLAACTNAHWASCRKLELLLPGTRALLACRISPAR